MTSSCCDPDGRLYSATTVDRQGLDSIVLASQTGEAQSSDGSVRLRTDQFNSKMLNQPNHVGALDFQDKVYFLFREMAVEHINCGKVRH